MILLKNVNLPLETDFSDCIRLTAKALKINENDIKSAILFRRSVDARHKNNIVFCCSFLVELKINEGIVLKRIKNTEHYEIKEYSYLKCSSNIRPIIVGFGPAGMFAALTLARSGLKPIVLERGRDVDTRINDVEHFFKTGELNTESNIQFGEGGAGTFSDGKLNTGIKDARIRHILKTFCEYGADKKIMYDAKPHIGTDVLRCIVKNIRNDIIGMGGEVRFESRLTDIKIANGRVCEIKVNECEIIPTDILILATGHSARDTFYMLRDKNVELARKPFSVGSRIEHSQKAINKSLYGEFAEHTVLGAADYKMAVHLENGRGVYTFCMCPGGEVVNASSEREHIAVNGMSYSARDGENANSALLVDVKPEDLKGDDVLAGIEFQREIEGCAYKNGGGAVPFCYVSDLLCNNVYKKVTPSVKSGYKHTDIYSVLPDFVCDSLKAGITEFGKKIKGFDDGGACLVFPETRSSSPVRILRNQEYTANGIDNLYPIGEGAGYAGGIMSAAVDGMRVAEAVINKLNI